LEAWVWRRAKFDAIVEQVFAAQLTDGEDRKSARKFFVSSQGLRSPEEEGKERCEGYGKSACGRGGKQTEATAAAAKAATKAHHRERWEQGSLRKRLAITAKGAAAKKSADGSRLICVRVCVVAEWRAPENLWER